MPRPVAQLRIALPSGMPSAWLANPEVLQDASGCHHSPKSINYSKATPAGNLTNVASTYQAEPSLQEEGIEGTPSPLTASGPSNILLFSYESFHDRSATRTRPHCLQKSPSLPSALRSCKSVRVLTKLGPDALRCRTLRCLQSRQRREMTQKVFERILKHTGTWPIRALPTFCWHFGKARPLQPYLGAGSHAAAGQTICSKPQ